MQKTGHVFTTALKRKASGFIKKFKKVSNERRRRGRNFVKPGLKIASPKNSTPVAAKTKTRNQLKLLQKLRKVYQEAMSYAWCVPLKAKYSQR